MQPAFGLTIGPSGQEVAPRVAHDHIRYDLFPVTIFLDQRPAAKRVVAEDVFQAAVKMGRRKDAGEKWVYAGGWYDEDIFVHAGEL